MHKAIRSRHRTVVAAVWDQMSRLRAAMSSGDGRSDARQAASESAPDVTSPAPEGTEPSSPIIAGMASVPGRSSTLDRVIRSVIDQIDHLYVYLNGYESVPAFLGDHHKITVIRSQEHGDLADNGKFFGVSNHAGGIYFGLDDDLIYPDDYVEEMLRALEKIDFLGVVGVHGIFYPTAPESFMDRKTIHYHQSNRQIRPVSLLGTGTIAFPIQLLNLDLQIFRSRRMADVWLGAHLKDRRIPMFAVSRPENWLVDVAEDYPSIWLDTKENHVEPSNVIVSNRPWGVEDLIDRIEQTSLSDRLPSIWSEFCVIYRALRSGNIDPAAEVVLSESERIASYVRFYCERRDLLTAAEYVLRHAGHDAILFDQAVQDCEAYDPGRVGRLLDEALSEAARHEEVESVGDLAARATRCFRAAGDISRAEKTLSKGIAVAHGSPALIKEAINLALTVGDYRRAREYLLSSAAVLRRDADHRNVFAVVLAHSDSVVEAAPWICDVLMAGRGRARGRLIAGLRDLYGVTPALSTTVSYELLERACMSGGVDALPAIHLNLALGDRVAAARLLAATRTTFEDSQPDHLPYLEAATAPTFEAVVEHLNSALEKEVLGGLEVAPPGDADGSPLTRLGGTFEAASSHGFVSVIMSTFNCADTVGYAIESILDQTISDLELIIVDDGSSDDTEELVAAYAARDARIVKLRAQRNAGRYACRNVALDASRADYIAINESDAYAHPQRLEYQLRMMADWESIASYVAHVRIADDGALLPDNSGRPVGADPTALMMRRRVVEDLGYFVPVRCGGDLEYQSRIVAFYGSERVNMSRVPLVLARGTHPNDSSISEVDPAKSETVARLKANARRRHTDATGRREVLYVASSESATNGREG